MTAAVKFSCGSMTLPSGPLELVIFQRSINETIIMTQSTILVVEDSPTTRRMTVNVLEDAGYRVVTATDGEEAISVAQTEKPDAVVLDIILPKKNGYQVCRQLKQDPDRSVPVLMVTAKDQAKDRVWGHRQGADAYLSKPVNEKELVECVEALLGLTVSRD